MRLNNLQVIDCLFFIVRRAKKSQQSGATASVDQVAWILFKQHSLCGWPHPHGHNHTFNSTPLISHDQHGTVKSGDIASHHQPDQFVSKPTRSDSADRSPTDNASWSILILTDWHSRPPDDRNGQWSGRDQLHLKQPRVRLSTAWQQKKT